MVVKTHTKTENIMWKPIHKVPHVKFQKWDKFPVYSHFKWYFHKLEKEESVGWQKVWKMNSMIFCNE